MTRYSNEADALHCCSHLRLSKPFASDCLSTAKSAPQAPSTSKLHISCSADRLQRGRFLLLE